MERLSPNAVEVLRSAEVEGHQLKLTCGQLDRALYEEVNEVLERLRGKWKRGHHLFPYDPTIAIQAVVESEEMPPRNPYAYFPTPQPVIDAMMEELGYVEWMDEETPVLEPSAGDGAIVVALRKALPSAVPIHAVELDPLSMKMLHARDLPNIHTYGGDFLTWGANPIYRLCVMNPPFSVEGNQYAYIDHIMRAYELLANGGKLISIIPATLGNRWPNNKKLLEFADFARKAGDHIDLWTDAFKESGAGVKTQIVVLEKQDVSWCKEEYLGYGSKDLWDLQLYIENNRELERQYRRLIERIQRWETNLFGTLTDKVGIKAVRSFYDEVVQSYCQWCGDCILLTEEEYQSAIDALMDAAREEMEYA